MENLLGFEMGYWKFEIIWDLVLGIWNLLYANP